MKRSELVIVVGACDRLLESEDGGKDIEELVSSIEALVFILKRIFNGEKLED